MTFEGAHQLNLCALDQAWEKLRACAADVTWVNQNDDYKRLLRDLDSELNRVFRFKNAWAEARCNERKQQEAQTKEVL